MNSTGIALMITVGRCIFTLQEFAEQVEQTARSVAGDIHTALPGKVVSFDPKTCFSAVKPVGKYQTSDGVKLDYPLLTDVPVIYPCDKNGVGMVFPVSAGDSCLIIISETELDEWRSGAVSQAPLRFDLSSAVMIPGLCRTGTDFIRKAVDENAAIITDGTAEIVLKNGRIEISGDVIFHGNVTVDGINMNTHRHSGYHGMTGGPE